MVLLILQSANAITFPTLVPTGKHNIASEPPEPTPGLRLHHRDSFASLETLSSVQTETPAVCGWLDTTDIDPGRLHFLVHMDSLTADRKRLANFGGPASRSLCIQLRVWQ